MKHLYFVRHGESELNAHGIYAGQIDTPLTHKGRMQAAQAGRHADRLHLDLIVASPLIRALETAQIIADEADYPIDRIITNGLLMERSYGSFAGQPFSAERDPVRFPDIESDEQLTARVQAAYDFLCDLAAENVLVVGHGDYAMILQHLISPEAPVEELPNAEIVQLM